jgi:hypothetical protein
MANADANGPSDDLRLRHDAALKYLDLARAEILERVGFVNKTLAAYVAGSAAIFSWFFQYLSRSQIAQESSYASLGMAVVFSYLALCVNWIIHHNERMISALAFYQQDELSEVLIATPVMWEKSQSLARHDGKLWSVGTILFEEFIVFTPALLATIHAWKLHPLLLSSSSSYLRDAVISSNLLNIIIGASMFLNRSHLRNKNHRKAKLQAQP